MKPKGERTEDPVLQGKYLPDKIYPVLHIYYSPMAGGMQFLVPCEEGEVRAVLYDYFRYVETKDDPNSDLKKIISELGNIKKSIDKIVKKNS